VFCGEPLVSVPTDDHDASLTYLATGECVGEECPAHPAAVMVAVTASTPEPESEMINGTLFEL